MEDPPAMISIILVIFVICKLSQFRERKVIVTSRHGSSPPWCSASLLAGLFQESFRS